MRPPVAHVDRPGLLGLVVGCVAGLTMVSAVSLQAVRSDLERGPAVVAVGAEALEEALAEAPATDAAPFVGAAAWYVTAPDCTDCRRMETEVVSALSAAGVQVQVIQAGGAAVAPRSGLLGDMRSWIGLEACDGLIRTACASEPPARFPSAAPSASYARLEAVMAANGLEMRAPALFWRRGPEWRAAVGADPRAAREVLRDLSAES